MLGRKVAVTQKNVRIFRADDEKIAFLDDHGVIVDVVKQRPVQDQKNFPIVMIVEIAVVRIEKMETYFVVRTFKVMFVFTVSHREIPVFGPLCKKQYMYQERN